MVDLGANLSCPLCGHDVQVGSSDLLYQVCGVCGLQFAIPEPRSGILTNQSVGRDLRRPGLLQLEQARITRKSSDLRQLVDLGCSRGGFIFACLKSRYWDQVLGVEPDPLSRRSAQEDGFKVYETLQELSGKYSLSRTLFTMWHSLEHLSAKDVNLLLAFCSQQEKSELVIAVPNSDSYLYSRFGTSWAYYDGIHHFFQFNEASLKSLASIHGFNLQRLSASLVYEVFAVLQTILNTNKSRPRNYLYTQIKREGESVSIKELLEATLSIICHPLLLIRSFSAILRSNLRSVLIVRLTQMSHP